MNIPLDRLYQYIKNLAEESSRDAVIIYRFWPHGSKNYDNLAELDTYSFLEKSTFPAIVCHDQEPLDYTSYNNYLKNHEANFLTNNTTNQWAETLKSLKIIANPVTLNFLNNIFEKNLLLHSEKRSPHLEVFRRTNKFIPVYYWSHALLSRDWFRFAEHVTQQKQVDKTFLIYSRAWSGTREYRLRFAELLIRLDLHNYCKTSVNPIEPELNIHYDQHQFKNPKWRPQTVLEDFLPTSDAHSHYSADFDLEDYESTDIEIVLETLFDDRRLHLTEKSLRPIACGQPFILAGTHGSLEYLRSYGFKTFSDIWDESYDECIDPEERLICIADLMKQITTWLPHQRESKMAQARAIAEYNRQHFFSKEFFDLVVDELKTNLKIAFDDLSQCNNYQAWQDRWDNFLSYPEVVEFLNTNNNNNAPTKLQVDFILDLTKKRLACPFE
jgi:predicted XRE-type DNA-binding protein